REPGTEKIIQHLTMDKTVRVVNMSYHLGNRLMVFQGVGGFFHSGYKLAQDRFPVFPLEVFVREEIMDNRPYAKGGEDPVFGGWVVGLGIGIIGRGRGTG